VIDDFDVGDLVVYDTHVWRVVSVTRVDCAFYNREVDLVRETDRGHVGRTLYRNGNECVFERPEADSP